MIPSHILRAVSQILKPPVSGRSNDQTYVAPSYALPRTASRKRKQMEPGIKDELHKKNQDGADQITTAESEMTVRAACAARHVAPAPHSP